MICGCFVSICSINFFNCLWELKVTKISSTYLLSMLGQKSCGQSEIHCFSKWQRNALAKVYRSEDPMATPSKCQNYSLLYVKNDSYDTNLISSLRSFLIRLWTVSLLEKGLLTQFLIVSSNEMLVRRLSMVKVTVTPLAFLQTKMRVMDCILIDR